MHHAQPARGSTCTTCNRTPETRGPSATQEGTSPRTARANMYANRPCRAPTPPRGRYANFNPCKTDERARRWAHSGRRNIERPTFWGDGRNTLPTVWNNLGARSETPARRKADGRAIGDALVSVNTLNRCIPSTASLGENESTGRRKMGLYSSGATSCRTSHASCPAEWACATRARRGKDIRAFSFQLQRNPQLTKTQAWNARTLEPTRTKPQTVKQHEA